MVILVALADQNLEFLSHQCGVKELLELCSGFAQRVRVFFEDGGDEVRGFFDEEGFLTQELDG